MTSLYRKNTNRSTTSNQKQANNFLNFQYISLIGYNFGNGLLLRASQQLLWGLAPPVGLEYERQMHLTLTF